MSTPRRASERLTAGALAILLTAAGSVRAAEPTELADDLDAPTALTVAPGPGGALRVLVAEAGRLTEFRVLGEAVLSRLTHASWSDQRVAALAVLDERALLAGAGGIALTPLGGRGEEPLAFDGPPVRGSLAATPRWLFAVGQEDLLRSRLAAGRVTPLRGVGLDATPTALTLTPEGYLVALAEGRLRFFDPEAPSVEVAGYPQRGAEEAVALFSRPPTGGAGPALYALTPGGLLRLELRLEEGAVVSDAVVALPLEGAAAAAFAPDGVLFVVTRSGRLLRFRGDF